MEPNPELVSRALARAVKVLAGSVDKGFAYGTVTAISGETCQVQPLDEEAAPLPAVRMWLTGSTDRRKPLLGAQALCIKYGPADYALLYATAWDSVELSATEIVYNGGLNGGLPLSAQVALQDNVAFTNINIIYGKISALAAALMADSALLGLLDQKTKVVLTGLAATPLIVPASVQLQYENPIIKQ